MILKNEKNKNTHNNNTDGINRYRSEDKFGIGGRKTVRYEKKDDNR